MYTVIKYTMTVVISAVDHAAKTDLLFSQWGTALSPAVEEKIHFHQQVFKYSIKEA